MIDLVVDFSRIEAKRDFMARLSALIGQQHVIIKKYRKSGTGQQARYFHGVQVRLLHEFMLEHGGKQTFDDAKGYIKAKLPCMHRTMFDPRTGESLGEFVESTANLDIDQYSELIEATNALLSEEWGIICPDPKLYAGA